MGFADRKGAMKSITYCKGRKIVSAVLFRLALLLHLKLFDVVTINRQELRRVENFKLRVYLDRSGFHNRLS